jgi:hypothetical protein
MNFDWQRLFTPSSWIQSAPTDWGWDAALNAGLDKNPIFGDGLFIKKVGVFNVWIGNYPYAFGTRWLNGYDGSGLPSMKTRRRLKRLIGKQLIDMADG